MFIPDRTATTFHPYQAEQKSIKITDFPYENAPKCDMPALFVAGVWNKDGSLRCLFRDGDGDGLRFSVNAKSSDNFTINYSLSIPIMMMDPGDNMTLKLSEEDEDKTRFNNLMLAISNFDPIPHIKEMNPTVNW